jgi:uncharacterized protein (TIGR02678 family)
MNPIKPLDEKAQQAAEWLMEQYWILRDQEPEKYRLIRERESELKQYFYELLGFHLIIHLHFIKLEKIPSQPESWMGIPTFSTTQHYVMLCCLLAFLEEKQTHVQQFILSDLCDYIRTMYPPATPIKWENYTCRRILVQVLKFAEKMNMIKTVEGQIDTYSSDIQYEVLYDIEVVSRYFMRFLSQELYQKSNIEQLLNRSAQAEETLKERKIRLYQQLILSPVVYIQETGREDFEFIRSKFNYLRDEIESCTPYQFELYSNTALVVTKQDSFYQKTFPSRNTLDFICLQLASLVRNKIQMNVIDVDSGGIVHLTYGEMSCLLNECKRLHQEKWSKRYRVISSDRVMDEVLSYLVEWKMARVDGKMSLIQLLPLFGRLIGEYTLDEEEIDET